MSDNILVGNAEKKQGQYGDYVRLGFNAKDLKTLSEIAGDGWVNIILDTSKAGKLYMKVLPNDRKGNQSAKSDLPF